MEGPGAPFPPRGRRCARPRGDDHLRRLGDRTRGPGSPSPPGGGSVDRRGSSNPGARNRRREHRQRLAGCGRRAGLLGARRGLDAAVDLAWLDVWWRERPADGLRQIELALERYPLDSLPSADRPYLALAGLHARAGKPRDARRFVAQFEETVDPTVQRTREARHWAAGEIALAEGKPQEAIQHFERWDAEVEFCHLCALPQLAEAYDRAGEADSTIAFYERYLNTPSAFRHFVDNFWRARSYKRLGELHEERGDSRKAVEYYDKFVELWADADPELQPIVGDVKDRIARLVGER